MDGHAEVHHWLNACTTPRSEPDGAFSVLFTNLPVGQRSDYFWVITHMSVEAQLKILPQNLFVAGRGKNGRFCRLATRRLS